MDKKELITDTIKELTGFMQVANQTEVKEEDEEGALAVSIQVPGGADFLIGKDGQNLKALEQVIRLIVWKKTGERPLITVDINNYRRTKATQAIETAKQAVARVRDTKMAEALMPMSSYERRIVHMELAGCPDIVTESIGEEPQRRIVIKPLVI